jgi:Fanconi anemia group M protein
MGELGRLMEDVLSTRLNELHTLGILPKRDVSSKELLDAQRRVQNLLLEKKHPELYRALSLIAEVFKIKHGINLIETQGIFALKRYFDRLKNEAESKKGSKASKRLISEPKIRTLLQRLEEQRVEHPKLMVMSDILIDQIRKNPYSKTIVFTNYRDTTEMISAYLSDIEGINAIKFIGQASKYMDKGLTQKQQVDIIDKFKDGEYNVLVATSVAEEGLDIPSTDLVLFYEPVPSEIRSIQRKGRTGRRRIGKIIVLITNKTKDEGYYWISKMKEEKMYREMKVLQASLGKIPMEMRRTSLKDLSADSPLVNHISADSAKPNQILLRKIGQHGVKIFVDQREMRSSVVKDLERLGADLVIRTMEVGDYVVSERVYIERKRVEDLSGSMTNKYIFDQLSDLKRTYERPLLIIEGDVYHSNVHPNAIRGLLASIAIDFGIPIIQTRDEEDTASFILTIAKREKEERREFNPHGSKRNSTLREEQEYVVSSISNIGPAIARNLLRHFKSVEEVVTAPKEELMRVERVGSVTANRIRDVISSKYE